MMKVQTTMVGHSTVTATQVFFQSFYKNFICLLTKFISILVVVWVTPIVFSMVLPNSFLIIFNPNLR